MIPRFAGSTGHPPNVPDVRAERCVHSVTEQASCCACVDACPTGAWVIDDEMLGIDANLCDGCDLCVPACPEDAIVQRFRPAIRRTPRGSVALACCEQTRIDGAGIPRMPCLHAIGLSDLLRLVRDEVRYLVTAAGDCDACPRGKSERLENRLRPLNGMLSDRSLPTIDHRPLDAESWRRTWHRLDSLAAQNRVSRRSFFRSAVEQPAKCIEQALDRAEGRSITPGSLLPRGSPEDPAPFVPRLDQKRCSGCDACARLCPHNAIRIELEGALPTAYVIDVDQCTGCGICVDVCEQAAVDIRRWQPTVRERLSLTNRRCAACGVTYHLPRLKSQSEDHGDLCPVCVKTGHHEKLYQVLN
jgi:ferredoxin